jgi:predicted small secreted protein
VSEPTLFPCDPGGKTVFAGLMKTLSLPIIVVASALSLASANAMPDLGRETGKFIRNDEPAPKDVRSFPGNESKDSTSGVGFWKPIWSPTSGPRLTLGIPLRPPTAA